MYFENFPQVIYSLDSGLTSFNIVDVFTRVKADVQKTLTRTTYDEYDVRDGETPEILADKFYGNVNLYWIILIANEILDPRFDWPLTTQQLSSYITGKYGVGYENDIHHYVTNDSYADVVHSSYAGSKLSVTNTVYEEGLNDAKRRIKILKRQFVPDFVNNFNRILNG
jgi:hypothetical protein